MGGGTLTWKPEKLARSGDEIEYQVQPDDGGPPLAMPPLAMPLGRFTYDPWWAQAWRENRSAVISGLAALAILLVYAAGLGLALVHPSGIEGLIFGLWG
jgi:hypothetical protein